MNLHEYQAKELLKSYGLPIQEGIIAHNGEEAAAAFDKTTTDIAVIKAQVHAGGRGKAGGIIIVNTPEELSEATEKLFNLEIKGFLPKTLPNQPCHL